MPLILKHHNYTDTGVAQGRCLWNHLFPFSQCANRCVGLMTV